MPKEESNPSKDLELQKLTESESQSENDNMGQVDKIIDEVMGGAKSELKDLIGKHYLQEARSAQEVYESEKKSGKAMKKELLFFQSLSLFLTALVVIFFVCGISLNDSAKVVHVVEKNECQNEPIKLDFKNTKSWDTSSVKSMDYMFHQAELFNQDISHWDVSNVTSMKGMFKGAKSFSQDLSSWCVKHITQKPKEFDLGSGFEGRPELQPQWGTCP